MINRCKTLARSAMNQVGSELYLASAAYILVPMAFSMVIGMQVNVPYDMMMLEPQEMLARLGQMLTPAQMAYLAVGSVITSLVTIFLNYGFTFYTLKAARYETVRFNDLFVGFQRPGRVIIAHIIVYFKMLAWSLISFLPILAVGILVIYTAATTDLGVLVGVWITVILALMPFLLINMRYEQTMRILADDPDLTASEAVRLSVEMMKGNSFALFKLRLSFILWDILSYMTKNITAVYSQPYMMCAEAAFYDEISSGFGLGGRPADENAKIRQENTRQDFDSLR